MEITKIDLNVEMQLLTGMIVSKNFIDRIIPILDQGLLESSEVKLVMAWTLSYYKKYGKAPYLEIGNVFARKRRRLKEADAEWIDAFLVRLSEDFALQGLNEDHLFDRVIEYFRRQKLEKLSYKIIELLEDGKDQEAEDLWINSTKTPTGIEDLGFDPFDMGTAVDLLAREDQFRTKMTLGIDCLDKMTGPLKSEWLIMCMGPMKRGKCIAKGSLVVLSDGTVDTIENIIDKRLSKKIVSYSESKNKFCDVKINEFWDNGIKPVWEVTTKTGRQVRVTKEHPFLTISGWKPLNDLNKGDYIGVPSGYYNLFGKISLLPDFKIKLLAYMLAEGGLTGGSFNFTNSDYNIKKDFQECVEAFGDKVTWVGMDKKKKWYLSDGITCSVVKNEVRVRSKLADWFIDIEVGKVLSKHKVIPKIVFSFNKYNLSLFLRILFTCDGSIYDQGNDVCIQYVSASKLLVYQVQHLLLRFGIIGTVREKTDTKGFVSWRISIRDSLNVLRYIREIGFEFILKKIEKANKCRKRILTNNKFDRGFIDNFPSEFAYIIRSEVDKFVFKNGPMNRKWWKRKPLRCLEQSLKIGCGMNKFTVKRINELISSKVLDRWLKQPVLWDKIINIKYVGRIQTYDLTINETSNFISNDVIVHNTNFLTYVAVRALLLGLNVVFISLESGEGDSAIRFWMNVGALTTYGEDKKMLEYPMFKDKQKGDAVNYEKRSRPKITAARVARSIKKFRKMNKGKLRVKVYPAFAAGIDDFDRYLDGLEAYERFTAHVIIVDYVGIIAAPAGYKGRDVYDYNAKRLKGISQIRKALVFSGTQGTRATLDKLSMVESDVPEEIRQLAHVDVMYGLNQTAEEKDDGIMRVNMIVHRHRLISKKWQAKVLQQPEAGQFYLDDIRVEAPKKKGKKYDEQRGKDV